MTMHVVFFRNLLFTFMSISISSVCFSHDVRCEDTAGEKSPECAESAMKDADRALNEST